VSKREQAIRLLAGAAREFEESSHLVLIDSATLAPEEAGRATNLMSLAATGPTDTAADLPAIAQLYQAINIKLDKTGGLTEALRLKSDYAEARTQLNSLMARPQR